MYKATFTSLYYSMMDPEDKEPTAFKLIVQGPDEKVVGLHLIGVGSDEMLQGFAVAIKMGGKSTRPLRATARPLGGSEAVYAGPMSFRVSQSFQHISVLQETDSPVFLAATKRDFDDTVAIHPTSAEGEFQKLKRHRKRRRSFSTSLIIPAHLSLRRGRHHALIRSSCSAEVA